MLNASLKSSPLSLQILHVPSDAEIMAYTPEQRVHGADHNLPKPVKIPCVFSLKCTLLFHFRGVGKSLTEPQTHDWPMIIAIRRYTTFISGPLVVNASAVLLSAPRDINNS